MTRWTEQEYANLLQKRGQEPSIPFKPTHTMPQTDGMNKLESRYAREVLLFKSLRCFLRSLVDCLIPVKSSSAITVP